MLTRVSVVVLLLFLTACTSETNETITDADVDVTGDGELPSAVVSVDRPENPATSYELPCPWGEVEDPVNNPYLDANVFPDDIASIEDPVWVPVSGQNFDFFKLEPIIVIEVAGQVRGVPVRILLWHEVVNMCWDTPDGPKYTYLTYCPLVDAAVHFTDERGCNVKLKYGVSGAIFNGNLVTFDRRSNNQLGTPAKLFVQLYAGGISETCATVEPATQHLTWEMFKRLYPYADILSEETGNVPPGGYDFVAQPYWDYWRRADIFFAYAAEGDPRVWRMQPVFGVLTPTAQKAYPLGKEDIVVTEEVGGQRIVVWYDETLDSAAGFEAVHDGQALTFEFLGREERGVPLYEDQETGTIWTFDGIAVQGPLKGERLARVVGIRAFWFAWASMYLDTEVYDLPEGSPVRAEVRG